jgi:hypothetical protein
MEHRTENILASKFREFLAFMSSPSLETMPQAFT